MASAKKTKCEACLLHNKYVFRSQLCCFKTKLIQWASNVSLACTGTRGMEGKSKKKCREMAKQYHMT